MKSKEEHIQVMLRITFNSELIDSYLKTCWWCHYPYLTDGAVPASLYVVLALIAGVHEAVLALVVQLDQHAHCAPFASPQ